MANKQDVPGALPPEVTILTLNLILIPTLNPNPNANPDPDPCSNALQEIAEGLGMTGIKDRPWAIFKCSAMKNEGVSEGLDWIATSITGS